jgi:hypothetical protein
MAIGNNVPQMGYNGVLAIAKETTFGTFVTGTTWVEFNSESLKYNIEEVKIETINTLRSTTRILQGNISVDGSIEAPLNLAADSNLFIVKSVMGGTVSSAVASTGSYLHTFTVGDLENNRATSSSNHMKSLSISVRPGEAAMTTWNFYGCRVNSWTLKAETGSPVLWTAEIVGKGCSTGATIPAAVFSDVNPCMFNGVYLCAGTTLGACTTTSQEYVKSLEVSIKNNLVTDQRVLGDDEVVGLPAGKREITLKVSQIFDTITAYNRYIQATDTAFKIVIDSLVTMGADLTTYAMDIYLPRCRLSSPFTPAVGDSGPIMQELEYKCLYATEKAYDMAIAVRNKTASYD